MRRIYATSFQYLREITAVLTNFLCDFFLYTIGLYFIVRKP